MINVHLPDSRRPPPPSSAFSFLSRGWREVRDSADADLRLIKDRARELENLIHKSTSLNTFSKNNNNNQNHNSTNSTGSVDFVQRLTRAYSSPDFKGWAPRGKIGIDLSAIRSAMEVEGVREFRLWEGEERVFDWEPIKKSLKKGFEGFDRKIDTSELLESIKNSEFVGKVKSSLDILESIKKLFAWEVKSSLVALNSELELPYVKTRKAVYKDLGEPQEVPPLDVPELLAHLVRQSGPFLDQLGVKRDLSDKLVESLCSKRKNQLLSRSLSSGDTTVLENDCISDELDLRIASVLQSTGHHYEGGFWTDHPKQDFSDGKRSVAIVTTASLPWMTGTAVNPLFRAAYLSKSEEQNVTLLIPWLCRPDQELVYPNNLTFSSPEEQEVYIRKWLEERVGFKTNFKISFYPGKFSKGRRSIIPAGDTSQFIPTKDADIAILEEPEHLNWYHHGRRWTDKFNHVVGIVHTNYLEYIKREKNGDLQAFFVKHINNWVTRAHCDKVVRLSAATQDLPKSIICNVHGVNPKFLEIGEKVAADRVSGQQSFTKGAYFLGKLVWAKGYRELIDILDKHKSDLTGFNVDVFGNGEDAHEVQSTAKRLDLSLNFMKGRDHADDSLHGYKVFINPSVSDVLCTATAEALAMGKFVVCADHPSNEFFRSFPNCLTYKTPEDFVAKVKEAMANEPEPLSPEERYNLSWEAANERFMEYSELNKFLNGAKNDSSTGKDNGKFVRKSSSMPNLAGIVDGGLAFAHYCFTGSEILRLSSGGIPGTREYDNQFCKDLQLLPPQVENPIYGW